MTHDTLRNILAEYAPELAEKIENKYILNVHFYISDTLLDDDDYFAFDTLESLRAFIAEKLADIRETIEFYGADKHNYSVEITYNKIDALVLTENPDLDLFPAEFPDNPAQIAYFEFGELGGRECTEITYDNYEWSGNDRLV